MNKDLDKETAIRLRELDIIYADDCEERHIVADAILCDLLTILGYTEVVEAFNDLYKWHA